MIRLIIALIGILLLWLWVASPFTKRVKIIGTVVAMAAAIAAVAYEIYDNKPRQGLITADQLTVCNLKVSHSYRSDYKVELCIKNDSKATLKRLSFLVSAERCDTQGACQAIETASADIPVTLATGGEKTINQTLRFERIASDDNAVSWSFKVVKIKAIP